MSDITGQSLNNNLLKLECHFTWAVFEEEIDIEKIEGRVHDQIAYLPSTQRHRLHNLLAYTSYLKGDNEEAIRQLQKAEEHLQGTQSADVDIKRAVIYSNYAWLFYHSNQLRDAQSYLEKVEAIYKKFESSPEHDVLLTEIYGEQAWALLTFYGKYCERAKECFEKALKLDPDNPELNSGYATVMYRLEYQDLMIYGTSKYNSLELLRRAVELNENDTVIKAYLALRYQSLGQAEEGEKIMAEALRQTPNSPYLLRYAAKFYRNEGKIDDAITILKKALNQTPNSGSLYYQIGLCYKKKMNMLMKSAKTAKSSNQPKNTYTRDVNEAISSATLHFEEAVANIKNFVEAYIELGSMYGRAGEFEKAEVTFQTVLHLKNLTCEDKQEIHFGYALFKQQAVRSESEAIKHYKEVLLIPNRTRVRSYSRNDLKQLAEQKVTKHPSDATGFGLLGFIYQQEGEVEQAIDYYEKALELDPDNEDYMSALCCLRLSLTRD
ncbi:interferon-induced protein with tetratricopeptide repeats 5 [Xenopus laevis]|uniref:Interferon-induced protein with tetratricopeptide repeats 5 n=1 Tax=Xenopus laevis TaxID=8355 RepID=A0A8J1L569_XENLA|nr:interferon-induced protein with tetratricopeptide repeats 5 [Xenopus laevis]